ncbi:hypothetical protein [Novosphingobium rosa]|uniref:hypothetical protein n=1 Tax=Novosphingobium rosa TaxID=76978 RepID=UPI0008358F58|nr:hypothetical protein [Novosphingobium rosa]
MTALRAFFLHHRRMAALLIALTLAMKALVPAGFMLGSDTRVLTVQICADALGQQITQKIVLPLNRSGNHAGEDKAKSDSPCHFTALGHAMLGGADPVLLAAALVFVLALGFAPVLAPAPRLTAFLRPPLRGPPALS